MNIQWEMVTGAVVSAVLTLGPWMFMVHAKLAVVAARLIDLVKKVDDAAAVNRDLWIRFAEHEARLETHDLRIAHIAERVETLA